jgi:hypothetical protein
VSEPGTLRLHGGQRAVNASDAPYRVVVSGRRWGKTELDKVEVITEFGTPGLVWFVALDFESARDTMWEPLKSVIRPEWLRGEPNESRLELETIWGCRFACKSAEHPKRLRGRGLRKVICDEFQDWMNGFQTWEEVLWPTLLTTNGRALFTGTPKSFNHLHKLFSWGQDPTKPEWASWQFITADAPHIDKAKLAAIKAQMDPRAYRQEFEASFEAMSGRAYYGFGRRTHVHAVMPDRHAPMRLSCDFNVNPAVGVLWQRIGEEARAWREVWVTHAGGEATRAMAQKARAVLQEFGWGGPLIIYGDATGKSDKTTGPSDHAVLREVFPLASWRVPKANPHVRDRVAAVNGRCETMDGRRYLTVDPTCEHLIADLEQVVFLDTGELDKKSNPMLTHISDAFGYGIHAEWPPVKWGGTGIAHMPHLQL